MNTAFGDGLAKIRTDLMNQQTQMMKTLESITKGDFKEKLREIMYNENKESEKKITIKEKPANMILTKSGELIFTFDDSQHAKEIFDLINKIE